VKDDDKKELAKPEAQTPAMNRKRLAIVAAVSFITPPRGMKAGRSQ